MRKYIEKNANGILFGPNGSFAPGKVVVRYTHDDKGKSMSFQFREIMISVVVEDLEDELIIKEVE